ncbi:MULTISPECIES: isopentenyl-diphosphate Delta-isomerase [Pedobacter]|uniref:Isopentenyl-diphosphate delta-isomerase n=1 Tax=Pedobacter zeae TaxID=1737356 RepID=A0A7W6K9Q2_9SPHI|nr:isopentenyl-diphosphate Delta-isomerase [Pedobacter zeae]MBB4106816.1 isopentenyl-diphosphate delta-isomerase [Pedobacter zeae]GGH03926.1 isopentenyl-diphosphate Delta-isomerase [Pedobacter zeae]
MEEQVILVDEEDVPKGQMGKMEAHEKGVLHRAFSVFIFNSKCELLLQQRALGKYHSAGLWTNTCCSHPRIGESNIHAASRRLEEEMGMRCELNYLFKFTYKAVFEDGLTEHEVDHVFFGMSDELPVINHDEVETFKYMDLVALADDIAINPERYTPWLRICFDKVIAHPSIARIKNGHTA